MTAVHLIWLASLAGAVLFFAAGAATVALRRRGQLPSEAAAPSIEPAAAPSDELIRLRAARDASEAAAREVASLRVRAEAAEANARDAASLRTRAEAAEAAHGALRGDLERLKRELATAHTANQQLRALADDRAKELGHQRTDSLAATREVEQLQARVHDTERELAERAQAQRDLSTENEQLKGRLRDIEGMRADYVRLYTAANEAEFLKREVARLEEAIRASKIDALGAQRRRPARGTVRPTTQPMYTIGEALTSTLEKFADSATRSIAIADPAGFPLASSGEDGQALAAYGALLFESANRAAQFLPVAAPSAIELIDERGARVSVWTFHVEAERFALVNLAVAPVDPARVEPVLARLSAILAPTAVATGT